MKRPRFSYKVPRKILVATAAMSILIFPSAGRADSQAGGLPALADRVLALEATTLTLQQLVTTLQANVASLQAANSSLQAALTQEAATRATADTNLQGQISQEATTRQSKDDSLQASIASVKVKAFQVSHDFVGLVQGQRAVVASTGPLPKGNYLVIGRVSANNTIHTAHWRCDLQRGDGIFIDDTEADTNNTFPSVSNSVDTTMVVNLAVVFLSEGNSVMMACQTGVSGSDLFSVRLTALQVPEATFDCPDLSQPCP